VEMICDYNLNDIHKRQWYKWHTKRFWQNWTNTLNSSGQNEV